MKVYAKVKILLQEDTKYRNNDLELMWRVWQDQSNNSDLMSKAFFINVAIPPETIRRARQLVQADFPELQATDGVRAKRKKRELEKGTFAYREDGQFHI